MMKGKVIAIPAGVKRVPTLAQCVHIPIVISLTCVSICLYNCHNCRIRKLSVSISDAEQIFYYFLILYNVLSIPQPFKATMNRQAQHTQALCQLIDLMLEDAVANLRQPHERT